MQRTTVECLFRFAIGLLGTALGIAYQDMPTILAGSVVVVASLIEFVFRNDKRRSIKVLKVLRFLVFICALIIASARLYGRFISTSVSLATPQREPLKTTNGSLTAQSIRIKSEVDADEGIVLIIRAYNHSQSISGEIRYPQGDLVWIAKKGDNIQLNPEIRIPSEEDVTIEALLVAVPKATESEVLDLIQSTFSEVASYYTPEATLIKPVSSYAWSKATEGVKDGFAKGRYLGFRVIKATDLAQQSAKIILSEGFELFWTFDSESNGTINVIYRNTTPSTGLESKPPITAIITTTVVVPIIRVQKTFIISPTLACPRQEMCITSPQYDVSLSSSQPVVEVWGTATKVNFSRYEFAIESTKCANGYCVIASFPQPVITGELMSFDISQYPQLENGSYWIRLSVIDNSGNAYPELAKFHVSVSR